MTRQLYILTAALLCLLSAIGAAQVALLLGVWLEVATMAAITAFVVNFFMIEPP
jgi:hypothetical protein